MLRASSACRQPAEQPERGRSETAIAAVGCTDSDTRRCATPLGQGNILAALPRVHRAEGEASYLPALSRLFGGPKHGLAFFPGISACSQITFHKLLL